MPVELLGEKRYRCGWRRDCRGAGAGSGCASALFTTKEVQADIGG
jgi:hypothetical protein